jgi:hypothetical protein
MSSEKIFMSRIKHLMTCKRNQIMDEIANKKNISKKQCKEWVEELVDIVMSEDSKPIEQQLQYVFDSDLNQSIDSKGKHNLRLKKKSTTDLKESDDEVLVSSPEKKSKMTTSDVRIENQINCHQNPGFHLNKENMTKDCEKGFETNRKIITVTNDFNAEDSQQSDPDWNQVSNADKSTKRQSKNKNKEKKSDEKSTDYKLSEGKVLGGDSTSTSNPLSREMLAKAAEERMAKLESRGSKGVVRLAKLSNRSEWTHLSTNNPLKWKM